MRIRIQLITLMRFQIGFSLSLWCGSGFYLSIWYESGSSTLVRHHLFQLFDYCKRGHKIQKRCRKFKKVRTWKITRRSWCFVIDTYGAEGQVPTAQMFPVVFLTANNCKRWRGIFKRLSGHGLSAPHPYVKAYRLMPFVPRSISRDSTGTVLIYNKYSWNLREIIYCKRAILSLSSSKILTPHPPLRLTSVSSPPTKAGGTHSPGGEGDGGSIFWKTREIRLLSYSK